MSRVFAPKLDSNKLTVTKGQKLANVIGSAKLDDVGLYNWGTKNKDEINRALVELVGCEKVDKDDPSKSVLDPALGTGGVIHNPVLWKPDKPVHLDKTHTIKVKQRLPATAVAITELASWFVPKTGTCTVKYRLEGSAVRADKTDFEVHATEYYEVKPSKTGETVEAPCGTDQKDDTHIWQVHTDNVKPSEQTVSWDGESTAKAGVLKPNGGKAYINSACAPYSALVRFYKDDADKRAKIIFKKPFYPRWTIGSGNTRTLDKKSLKVEWKIFHDNDKLKIGQLLIFDKAGEIVFRVALNEGTLQGGKLDLDGKWPSSEIKRDSMPYRVQIQAHSLSKEPNGLAVAAMPTMVRTYEYKKVQFIAFNSRPGGKYMGDADHDKDIKYRCELMKDAIQKASSSAEQGADTLKLFMGPEFYFRGPEGAYPFEKISTIVPQLREETDKIEYADWLFVFGTAIGYHKREDSGNKLVHGEAEHVIEITAVTATEVTAKVFTNPKVGWTLVQGTVKAEITGVTEVDPGKEYKIAFANGPVFTNGPAKTVESVATILSVDADPASKIVVKAASCSRIPSGTVGGTLWKAKQGSNECEITKCTAESGLHKYTLELNPATTFVANQPFLLIEAITTEVFNVALVQKGWPAPHMGHGSLRHVAVYKENISPIDFVKTVTDFHKADASERKIKIHGTDDRPVVPTEGSTDLGGTNVNKARSSTSTAGSEINKTGIGGGVVFTVDDVTFGLEVCLDHANNRLSKFYAGTTKEAGDPKVQLHLIPSWGMSIGGGQICCPTGKGLVFNVDGGRSDSVLRINDGTTYSCDDHPDQTGSSGGVCTKDERYGYCKECGKFLTISGNCDVHTSEVLDGPLKKCGGPKYYGCDAGCVTALPCTHTGCKPQYVCENCGVWKRVGENCGCSKPIPNLVLCDEYYNDSDPDCPTCTQAITKCNKFLMKIGAAIPPKGSATAVTKTNWETYMQRPGQVLLYDAKDIPDPDVIM